MWAILQFTKLCVLQTYICKRGAGSWEGYDMVSSRFYDKMQIVIGSARWHNLCTITRDLTTAIGEATVCDHIRCFFTILEKKTWPHGCYWWWNRGGVTSKILHILSFCDESSWKPAIATSNHYLFSLLLLHDVTIGSTTLQLCI